MKMLIVLILLLAYSFSAHSDYTQHPDNQNAACIKAHKDTLIALKSMEMLTFAFSQSGNEPTTSERTTIVKAYEAIQDGTIALRLKCTLTQEEDERFLMLGLKATEMKIKYSEK